MGGQRRRAGSAGEAPARDRGAARVGGVPAAPTHPGAAARAAGLWERLRATPGLQISEPLGYAEFTTLMCQARAVLTDSGGVQEGGLPGARAVSDPARDHGVGGDGGERLERARRPGPRGRPSCAERQPPREHPELYGDGHAARALRRGDRQTSRSMSSKQAITVAVVGLGYRALTSPVALQPSTAASCAGSATPASRPVRAIRPPVPGGPLHR